MQFFGPQRPQPGTIRFSATMYPFLLLLLLAGGAQAAAGGGGGEASIADGKTNYFTLEPAFVVNIIDGQALRFMQVEVDVVSMDSAAIEAIQDHRAPIRHSLLMLFAHRDLSEVLGLQQRNELRQQALERIRAALLQYADIKSDAKAKDSDGNKYPTGIQDVLFTSFVIQ
ncbi:hypothetical protein Tel_14810 [Candidatus Tenderia electrophaga]|jgi:flagellar FliL protein|uniref:Flagellar protein FliL n=1 Tax=Candidatus Tenderia electrophaga TaxID=1748243 RepID=A0A0S2TGL5_9GAMM|nr:hypothetical protein Tel_14810 [Candidatus Tenderia electrophaga]